MKFSKVILTLFLTTTSNLVVCQEGGEAADVVEEPVQVSCDEVCASQVAEAIRVCNQEKADLESRISPLTAALEQAQEASVAAASQVTSLKGEIASMETAVANAKAEVEATKKSAADVEAASHAELAKMADELAATKDQLASFEQARYFVNFDLIKADGMKLLQKYGLAKEEL